MGRRRCGSWSSHGTRPGGPTRSGEILAGHDAALCWADRLGRPVTPLWRTASWGFLRFHEGTADPWPRYGQQALPIWVDRIREAHLSHADVYVYFNNDPGGAAVVNSAEFAAAGPSGRPDRDPHPGRRGCSLNAPHTDLVILMAEPSWRVRADGRPPARAPCGGPVRSAGGRALKTGS